MKRLLLAFLILCFSATAFAGLPVSLRSANQNPDYWLTWDGYGIASQRGKTPLTNPTFTRGSVANYIDPDTGLLTEAAIDTARIESVGGRLSALIEPAGANLLLDGRDITGWNLTNMTAAQTSTGEDGNANKAVRLTATDANATAIMDAMASTSANHVYSLSMKRITGTGDVDITIDNGTTWTTKTLTGAWSRQFVTKAATNPQVGIRLATSGDAIDVDFHQIEAGKTFPSSPINTDGVSAGADLVTDGGFAAVTETNFYTSDFSAGVDGFGDLNGTAAGNIDFGGETDTLRFTLDGVNGLHYITISDFFTIGNCYRFRYKYYIPSGQSNVDGVRPVCGNIKIQDTVTVTNSWTSVDIYFTALGINGNIIFYAVDGADLSFQDAGADDVFYIKDIIVDDVTFTNWQTGTGWAPQTASGSLTGKAQKIAGTASNLEQSATAAEANKVYQLKEVIERTAGTLTPEFGSTDGAAISAAGTYYDYLIASDTDHLKFKADATFAGTVDVVELGTHGVVRQTESGNPYYDLPSGIFAEALGSELHTDANAASDPNSNEADATTEWSDVNLNGTGANVFESQGAVKDTGSYAFHCNANDTPTNAARIYKSFTSSQTEDAIYKVSFSARHVGVGGDWDFGIGPSSSSLTGGVFLTLSSTDNTFSDYVFYYKYNIATSRYFVIRENDDDSGGVYVDNFSIKEVTNAYNGNPPTFTLAAWVNFGYDQTDMSGDNSGIISSRSSAVSLIYNHVTGGFRSYDGSNLTEVDPSFTANAWYLLVPQVYIDSNVYKYRVGYRTEAGTIQWDATPAVYDGAFTLGSYLRFAYDLFGPTNFGATRLYKRVLGDAEINAIP